MSATSGTRAGVASGDESESPGAAQVLERDVDRDPALLHEAEHAQLFSLQGPAFILAVHVRQLVGEERSQDIHAVRPPGDSLLAGAPTPIEVNLTALCEHERLELFNLHAVRLVVLCRVEGHHGLMCVTEQTERSSDGSCKRCGAGCVLLPRERPGGRLDGHGQYRKQREGKFLRARHDGRACLLPQCPGGELSVTAR